MDIITSIIIKYSFVYLDRCAPKRGFPNIGGRGRSNNHTILLGTFLWGFLILTPEPADWAPKNTCEDGKDGKENNGEPGERKSNASPFVCIL